ncbi:hypothetical protein ACLVWU_10115 [Bdellovibrio sp. HCB290]|uniref:hypothetical protein n=1 Tax=Bdellovibrio sp. HCB290 TaxID=3394356 RepID=UPI0039B575F5
MKNITMTVVALFVSVNAFAGNLAVEKVADKMKANDTRTIITEVENTDGNPCQPEGKSYLVELQVKQAAFDREKRKVVYSWETVKTIGVDNDGRVMEVCAE